MGLRNANKKKKKKNFGPRFSFQPCTLYISVELIACKWSCCCQILSARVQIVFDGLHCHMEEFEGCNFKVIL